MRLILTMCLILAATSLAVTRVSVADYSPELLAKVIEAEAAGESVLGKYLVGSVIINRSHHPDWPSCVPEVIYDPHQFATPADTFSAESMRAATLAIGHPFPDIYYFFNPKTSTDTSFTKNVVNCFTNGNHRFCESCKQK